MPIRLTNVTKPLAAKNLAVPWKQFCSFEPPMFPPPWARMSAGRGADPRVLGAYISNSKSFGAQLTRTPGAVGLAEPVTVLDAGAAEVAHMSPDASVVKRTPEMPMTQSCDALLTTHAWRTISFATTSTQSPLATCTSGDFSTTTSARWNCWAGVPSQTVSPSVLAVTSPSSRAMQSSPVAAGVVIGPVNGPRPPRHRAVVGPNGEHEAASRGARRREPGTAGCGGVGAGGGDLQTRPWPYVRLEVIVTLPGP
jgi:hypothetical protein